jgi:hypothetical protein
MSALLAMSESQIVAARSQHLSMPAPLGSPDFADALLRPPGNVGRRTVSNLSRAALSAGLAQVWSELAAFAVIDCSLLECWSGVDGAVGNRDSFAADRGAGKLTVAHGH